MIILSFGGVFSKIAAKYDFLSFEFIAFYGFSLFTLLIYTLFWQKILKQIPLNLAYANKAVTIIWGMLWGILFFKEQVSIVQFVSVAIIIVGVIITITGGEKNNG